MVMAPVMFRCATEETIEVLIMERGVPTVYVVVGLCTALTGIGGVLCFFFQAEDGIRDYKVTGVQTCALPIYCCGRWPDRAKLQTHPARRCSAPCYDGWGSGRCYGADDHLYGIVVPCEASSLVRSEERRVGKECRSRWSPYH